MICFSWSALFEFYPGRLFGAADSRLPVYELFRALLTPTNPPQISFSIGFCAGNPRHQPPSFLFYSFFLFTLLDFVLFRGELSQPADIVHPIICVGSPLSRGEENAVSPFPPSCSLLGSVTQTFPASSLFFFSWALSVLVPFAGRLARKWKEAAFPRH